MTDVLLFCAAVLGLAIYVARPLYGPRRTGASTGAAGDARRESIDRALADLDLDRASALVDEPSYRAEKAALEAEAARRPDPLQAPND